MALSEVIFGLEPDESVKFTQGPFAIRFVCKKGDEQHEHKEIAMSVDTAEIKLGNIDILAVELRRAMSILRRD